MHGNAEAQAKGRGGWDKESEYGRYGDGTRGARSDEEEGERDADGDGRVENCELRKRSALGWTLGAHLAGSAGPCTKLCAAGGRRRLRALAGNVLATLTSMSSRYQMTLSAKVRRGHASPSSTLAAARLPCS